MSQHRGQDTNNCHLGRVETGLGYDHIWERAETLFSQPASDWSRMEQAEQFNFRRGTDCVFVFKAFEFRMM